jgi:hypothetical protein
MSPLPAPKDPHTPSLRISILSSLYRSSTIIKSHLPAFISIQAIFHSTILLSMLTADHYPHLHIATWKSTNSQLESSVIGKYVGPTYDKQTGSIFLAAPLTFIINSIAGSMLTITLPSFIIPFSGLGLLFTRAATWGLLFPLHSEKSSVWHYITMLMEGQAYVVAGLGVWIQSRDLMKQGVEAYKTGRWRLDWKAGWRVTKGLYPLIIAILGVTAVWEAIEVIHLG